MDDSGKLVQNGVTAGSRRAPVFHWARNIRDKALLHDYKNKINYKTSAAFALFWNMVKSTAPDDVVGDFEHYLKSTGICRMDGDGQMPHDISSGKGSYKVELEHDDGKATEFEFNNVELSPPTGVTAENYARYVARLRLTGN